MFTKIVAFSLALIPFFCWLGWDDGIRTPKEIASIICLVVIIISGFSLFQIKKSFNKYFFYFFGWCVVTLLFSNYAMQFYAKEGIIVLPSVLMAYKPIFYTLLALLSVQVICSSDIDLKFISKTITIVCLVMCGYCVVQLVGLDEWFRVADPNTNWVGKSIWDNLITNTIDPSQFGHYSRRIVGTLGNPSILGIWLSLCLPFCLYLKNRLGYITTIFSLIVIVLTLSLTAYISAVISLLFILFFKNKRLAVLVFVLLLISSIAIFLYVPQVKFMFNPTGRVEMLKEAFNILDKKAITGMGFGSFENLVGFNPEIVQRLGNQNWREAHNEYFQLWFEEGLIGLILILMGIFTMFALFLKNIRRETIYLMASMVSFFVVCLTYFPMRVCPLSFYGLIILGILINKIGDGK